MTMKLKCGALSMAMLFALASCKKSDIAESSSGVDPTNKNGAQTSAVTWTTVLNGTTFSSRSVLETYWNYLYPWGSDHNGSARMYASNTDRNHVYLENGGMTIKATRINWDEGTSTADPHLPIRYHSGAMHAKAQINVNDSFDTWEISGDFKAPVTYGSWPAFWITGATSWPPECDILEFKGSTTNWQNTVDGPDWQNTSWETTQTVISNAASAWHNYKLVLTRIKTASGVWTNDVRCQYYIDGVLKGTHTGTNHVNKPMWLIINMQMEGASGSNGPTAATYFYSKNIIVRKGKTT